MTDPFQGVKFTFRPAKQGMVQQAVLGYNRTWKKGYIYI